MSQPCTVKPAKDELVTDRFIFLTWHCFCIDCCSIYIGTMICCYMLHNRRFESASEALRHYGEMRTHDQKGVTIPSQRRYVEYYAHLLNSGQKYARVPLQVRNVFAIV